MSDYTNEQVEIVSDSLQEYMNKKDIECMTADKCATFLAENNILNNNVGPAQGFNFRQMLRDGRDGHIDLVQGAYQKRPKTHWKIYRDKECQSNDKKV